MPRPHAPRPRKRPRQARSRATVDAIVDAAARILVEGGWDAFSTNRVAERAGVSVGSLYQYFPNKEALLAELQGRHVALLERGLEETMDRVQDAPIPEAVAALIAANATAHLVEPELHRVLTAEVPHLGATDASTAFEQRAAARVRALLERRRRELAVRDLDLATYLIVRTVEGTIHEAVVERPADLASGAITREVTRLLVAYLTAGPRARRPARSRRGGTTRGRRARRH